MVGVLNTNTNAYVTASSGLQPQAEKLKFKLKVALGR